MQTMEWRTVDKSEWGQGPWQQEPDKKQWTDPMTGLPCLIVRGPVGALCGYVGVPRSHPAYQQGYDEVLVDVHGGLTFADFCSPSENPAEHICHTVEPGEDDKVWWLGFDCAHGWDITPKYTSHLSPDASYKDWAYVTEQVEGLARQLKAQA